MAKQDIVITASDRFTWPRLRNWVLSLDASGFRGRKVIVVYRLDARTEDQLRRHGIELVRANADQLERRVDFRLWQRSRVPSRFRRLWRVATGQPHQHIGQNLVFHMRFYHQWQFLAGLDPAEYRFAIYTDIRDLVFQGNPSAWLEANIDRFAVVASSESIRHRDEPWSHTNTIRCFGPTVYASVLQDQPVMNAGVIAGELTQIRDLFLQIYLTSQASPIVPADQAAYNLAVRSAALHPSVRFTPSEDGWACQAGTIADPTKTAKLRPYLLEPEPRLVDGYVCTASGKRYFIVHQYDRVPEWNAVVDAKYAEHDSTRVAAAK